MTMTSSSSNLKTDARFAVSSLLSPPESRRQDNFNTPMIPTAMRTPLSSFSSDKSRTRSYSRPSIDRDGKDGLPLSPPISPYTTAEGDNDECSQGSVTLRDPQLFGSDADTPLPADVPLFPESHLDAVVNRHIAASPTRINNAAAKPSREDYKLVLECVSTAMAGYNRNPRAWVERERSFYSYYGSSNRVSMPLTAAPLRRLAPAPLNGIKRPRQPTVPRIPRAARVLKRTPKTPTLDSFDNNGTPSPKTPRLPTNRDDVDYQALPDFSPPASTLPINSKALKADWKGQVLDLSTDPDRHMLHEAEVNLAATLRLSCATYLCSKRRIFQARLAALRIGKEFRKTDAQQACKIDVNKASKLWSAYDRVNWFRPEYFQQYA